MIFMIFLKSSDTGVTWKNGKNMFHSGHPIKVVKSKRQPDKCYAFGTLGSGAEARKLLKIIKNGLKILDAEIEAKQVDKDPTLPKIKNIPVRVCLKLKFSNFSFFFNFRN